MTVVIGLTGNIGCGKSTVGATLVGLGAEYVDADQIVHRLLEPGQAAVEQVVARFGEGVRRVDRGVERGKLGTIVFADRIALADLEAILHPAVREEIERRIAETRAPAIVIDAIKLIEGGLAERADSVWVVICDEADQVDRLVRTRGLTRDQALLRIRAQGAQADKVRCADAVLDNSGTPAALEAAVIRAYETLIGRPSH